MHFKDGIHKQMPARRYKKGSYEQALGIIMEYVEVE